MVIYNSGDSDNLIQALSANIKNAKEVFDKVNKGTQHLNTVIDSGTLSGAAYRAGQSLFQTYISPMIQKLDSAIADIQGDLNSYKNADQAIRAEGAHLDEAQLTQKLDNTNRLIQLVEQKIEEDKKVIKKFMDSGFEGVAHGLAEIPGLEQQVENLKSLKADYEKKLQALQTFTSRISSLFTDSSQAFKYALEGVSILNQSKASSDGTITFPAGSNMSWLSSLQGQKFSSKLSKNKKAEPVTMNTLAKSLGVSVSEAEKLCKKYKVQPNDEIRISFFQSSSLKGSEVKNVTTGELIYSGNSNAFSEFMNSFNGVSEQLSPFNEVAKKTKNPAALDPNVLERFQGGVDGTLSNVTYSAGQFGDLLAGTSSNQHITGYEYIKEQEKLNEEIKKAKEAEYAKNPTHNPNNHGLGGS